MLTPECCKECHRLDGDGNCMNSYKKCIHWRLWFVQEWGRIREAAQQVRAKQSPKGRK